MIVRTRRGKGEAHDLERIEEQGCMAGAQPECVSERAKEHQRREMGTLGSGNHYLEIQAVPKSTIPPRRKPSGLRRTMVLPFVQSVGGRNGDVWVNEAMHE
jgi:tRNA-splicing ligase RtcB